MTPADELRAAATKLRETAQQATPAPWWYDESDDCWRLHGTAGWTPAHPDLGIPAQPVNHQILKASKRGTDYAEYWPSPADSAWITMMSPALAEPLAAWLDSWAVVEVSEHGPYTDDWSWALRTARAILRASQ